MKNHQTEMIDCALSQAMESYEEMDPHAVYTAILEEWPEQIAVLLVELFFRTTCPTNESIPGLRHIQRENGSGSYLTPLCGCQRSEP